jgi:outer membrane biogenesis lipoprotein LolB
MKKILFYGLILVCMLYLAGCTGSGTSALIGKWVSEEEQDLEIEFFEDGTSITSAGEYKMRFFWTSEEKGKLTIKAENVTSAHTESLDYKISGQILTLDKDKFRRKK